jgi:hypothetical protein
MEQLPIDSGSEVPVTLKDPGHTAARLAMKHTRHFARRPNFAAMTPHSTLASTGYCLADPGNQYLIYQPKAGEKFSLELKPGTYLFEWFDSGNGSTPTIGHFDSPNGARPFQPPTKTADVLHLRRKAQSPAE